MSFEEGALCEPLVVALAAIERANIRLGDATLICGAGPIGLVSLLACRAAGATPIAITDLSAERLAFAKKLVPSVHTVEIERGLDPKDQAEKIKATIGKPFAVALECTGVESSVATAAYALKFGSTLMVIGVGKDEMKIPFGYCSANEIDLRFLYRYAKYVFWHCTIQRY